MTALVLKNILIILSYSECMANLFDNNQFFLPALNLTKLIYNIL